MSEHAIQFTTTTDGVTIAYLARGTGYPVIFVPGMVSHARFAPATPIYRGTCEVAYDKRGTGLSDRATGDYSIAARLLDIDAVADAAGFDRFALCGSSEGGPIAISYAAKHPDRVTGLMLYGTSATGCHWSPEVYEAARELMRVDWDLACVMLGNALAPEATAVERDRFVQLMHQAVTPEDALALWEVIYEVDVGPLLARVRCPTLVLHATDDGLIPFEQGRELAARIPNARLAPIDGRNHSPGNRQIGQLIPEGQAFLDELRASLPLAALSGGQAGGQQASEPLAEELSPRELGVLRLLADGKSNREIAGALGISVNTVERHVSHIFAKTATENRVEAANFAHRHGLA